MEKITQLTKRLSSEDIDALFITSQANISYLTDLPGLSYREREVFGLLTKKSFYLFIFPTSQGLYDGCNNEYPVLVITHDKSVGWHLGDISQKEKITKVGFEEEHLTVGELTSLQKNLSVKLIPTKGIVEKQRIIKDSREQVKIKNAAGITDDALRYIKTQIKTGVTEKELALKLEFFIKTNAADIAFPPIVAFGPHAAIPHYLPNQNQPLTKQTLILFDFGAKSDSYCADMTRVIFFGKPDNKFVKIYQTVLESQKIAIDNLNTLIKQKTKTIQGSDIDKKVKDYFSSRNFPPFQHGLGHGVGLEIHEAPRLRMDRPDILSPGMVFTIEPGVYLPNWGGIRIEDLVVFNDQRIEILSKSPKSIESAVIV